MREVQFRDLKIGENYFIQEVPENNRYALGRAKGINYLGSENFSFDRHTVAGNAFFGGVQGRQSKQGINFGNVNIVPWKATSTIPLSEGDPLVKFQEIVPLNERQTNFCDLCEMTHLKPFNEGQIPGIGYKFYEITQDKLKKRTDALRLRSSLPEELELNLTEVISEKLTGAERGSLKKVRHINPMNRNNPNEKRRLLATAAENRRRQSRKGGYKNKKKNKKKSKKNKKYNRNKATMKTKLKNKRKTRTKK